MKKVFELKRDRVLECNILCEFWYVLLFVLGSRLAATASVEKQARIRCAGISNDFVLRHFCDTYINVFTINTSGGAGIERGRWR